MLTLPFFNCQHSKCLWTNALKQKDQWEENNNKVHIHSLMKYSKLKCKNQSWELNKLMKKWFTEMLLSMDSMNLLHKKIFMFWTVKINQDKIWLKDIFTCNFCSCTQSALTSVKFHILIISWVSLKIQRLIHNCWVNVHSLNHMLI